MIEILIDTREQLPWEFKGYKTSQKALKTGDYSLKFLDTYFDDDIILERKTLDDFVGCCGIHRERFERELERSMEIPHFFIIIEGSWKEIEMGNYHSKINPNSVIGSILSWQIKYGCHILLTENRTRAKRLAIKIFENYLRNKVIKKKKKVGIKPIPEASVPVQLV